MNCAGANLVPCRGSVQASDEYILLAWRSRQDTNLRGETPLDFESNGNDNKIETTEKKEVSLFHIEELSSAQTNSNIITLIGFATIFLAMGFAILHIKFIKGPRRARKDHERANMMDRLTEMEDVMLEMGYLKRKKNLKKNKKTKTQNLTRKKIKTKTRKSTIEDSQEEDSDN